MNFQPSELAKLSIAMYAAGYMVRKMEVKENFLRAVLPMAVSVAVVGLPAAGRAGHGAFLVIARSRWASCSSGGVNGRMFLLITAGAGRAPSC
jgi:cell division protein FtsW